jgi:small subunit ribosomal protein S19e
MTDVRTIEHTMYNESLAKALKESGDFEVPEFVFLVKTSAHKKRPTTDEEFYFKRAASILRQIYIHGTVGTGKLRNRYGGTKNRGGKPDRFMKAGGKIIRTILQQAEKAGLLKKSEDKKKGRQITTEGKKLLEGIKCTDKLKEITN